MLVADGNVATTALALTEILLVEKKPVAFDGDAFALFATLVEGLTAGLLFSRLFVSQNHKTQSNKKTKSSRCFNFIENYFLGPACYGNKKGANLTHPRLWHREAPWREARQAAPGRARALGGSLLKIRGFQTRP